MFCQGFLFFSLIFLNMLSLPVSLCLFLPLHYLSLCMYIIASSFMFYSVFFWLFFLFVCFVLLILLLLHFVSFCFIFLYFYILLLFLKCLFVFVWDRKEADKRRDKGGTVRSRMRGNYTQDVLYEKNNRFSIREE